MTLFEGLLVLEGNVPIILDLKEHGRAYQKELERRVGMAGQSIKRSVDFMLEQGFLQELPYDGKVPNVENWLVLTELGERVGDCLADCRKKLSAMKRG